MSNTPKSGQTRDAKFWQKKYEEAVAQADGQATRFQQSITNQVDIINRLKAANQDQQVQHQAQVIAMRCLLVRSIQDLAHALGVEDHDESASVMAPADFPPGDFSRLELKAHEDGSLTVWLSDPNEEENADD